MDEDSVAGDLQVGGYASGEWAGSPAKPFYGFGFGEAREPLSEVDAKKILAGLPELWRRRFLEGAGGSAQTSPGEVRYISPDQLESWAAAEWDYDGDEAA